LNSRDENLKQIKVLYVLRPVAGGMLQHVQGLVAHFGGAVTAPSHLRASFPFTPFYPLPLSERLEPIRDYYAASRLKHIAKDFDIIHLHGYKAGLVGRMAIGPKQKPVVVTVHNFPATYNEMFFRIVEKRLSHRTSRYVAVSQALASRLTGDWMIPPEKVTTVVNGIDPPFCGALKAQAARLRQRLGIGPNKTVVGTLARLAPQKGIDLFIQAAVLVKDRLPGTIFLVGGSGPLRHELERLVEVLGLKGSLRFIGKLEEVHPYLAALDVFVLPSRSEGLSLTLMEAMACGVPVVAVAVGGVPEVVGEDGLLVAPAGHALAGGIISLVKNRDLRINLGARGPERVMRLFSLQRMLQETEAVYRSVLGEV